ncbi:MAG TPA: DUF1932 domain-containing protein, partial [Bryobacteraceae bacterium]
MLGFIGFGEAAYHITKGLRAAGLTPIAAYDCNAQTDERIRSRAEQTGTHLFDSNAALADSAEIILSAVTANQAEAAAMQTAPHLTTHHLYADINSVSPGTKQRIAAIISSTGTRFVEIAVMESIPPHLHKTPMLAGGPHAAELKTIFEPYGMSIEVVSNEIGAAAATKMFRSIMVKGLEALITECVLGASRYGADERVFASLAKTFPGIDWPHLADYMIGRVVVHGERRAREMEEVAVTLREAGVDPFLAEAIVRRMDWSAQLGLKRHFHGEAPKHYEQFLAAVS